MRTESGCAGGPGAVERVKVARGKRLRSNCFGPFLSARVPDGRGSMAGQPSELETTLNALLAEDGVTHYLVINRDGVPLRWSGWKSTTADYNKVVHVSALIQGFAAKARQYVSELLRDRVDERTGEPLVRARRRRARCLLAPPHRAAVRRRTSCSASDCAPRPTRSSWRRARTRRWRCSRTAAPR